MKSYLRILCIVIAAAFVLMLTPLRGDAITYEPMTYRGDLYYFDIGSNYEVTVYKGEIEYLFNNEYEYEITSAVCSDTSVLSIFEKEDWNIGVRGKKAGKVIITVKAYNEEEDVTETSKIKVIVKDERKSEIEASNWVYKNTKKVTVKAKNVKKGDIIKLKIGGKTYKKKVKKTASKYKVKIKIRKPGFYGKKYKLTLNRKGKVIAKEKQYVFLSDTVYVGYTKKMVKWLVYWNDPYKKNRNSRGEQWCYDWDDQRAYLYFDNKGVVTDWQIFEV